MTDVDMFAGVAVSDHPRAVTWFEALLGTPATFEPHGTESVLTVTEHAHVYVVLDPERAGRSLVTLFVDDLEVRVTAAASRGVHPATQETYDNGVRKVTYRDPDG